MRNILFELTARDSLTDTLTTVRMSSNLSDASVTLLDNKEWKPVILDGPRFKYSFASDGIPKALDVTYGAITFSLSKEAFQNLDWSALRTRGALASVWSGETGQAFPAYKLIYTGELGPVERRDDATASIALLGSEATLATRNLLTLTYAGTGGAEGPSSLTGQLKPWSFGNCQNVEPILIDAVNYIYQVNAYAPASINYAYEGALSLGAAKSNAADYAALKALTLVPGEWATANAVGMFRLGAAPTSKITADIGANATVGSVITALLTSAGIGSSKIDASVAAATQSYCLFASEQITVMEAARSAAYAGQRYMIPDSAGKWCLGTYSSTKTPEPLASDGSSATFVFPDSIGAPPVADPSWKLRIGHTHVWSPNSASEILGGTDSADVDKAIADAAAAKAAADAAKASADATKLILDASALDSIVDRGEKRELIREYESFTAEKPTLVSSASARGVSSTAYTNAYDALTSYLNGLDRFFTVTVDTPIDPTVFKQKFNDYTNARQALVGSSIPGSAATTATWNGVTGGGKPADNADVTGANTSADTNKVNGVAASTVTTNINTALAAVKNSGGNVVNVQTLIDANNAEIARATQDVVNARTDLGRDIGNTNTSVTSLQSQMAGTTTSGLQTLIKNNRTNLIDTSWWKRGASIPWGLNGGAQNVIYTLPDGNYGNIKGPDGSSSDVWLAQADNSGQAAGGWNGGPIAPLDPDKTYRFVVPIAALGGQPARSTYWGTDGVCALNSTNGYSNPYFAYTGGLPANRWYLFVGFIFPRNSTGKTNDGAGIFDAVTGAKIGEGQNFCFFPDGRQPIHRAYQYYTTTGGYQAFGRPIVEVVDGSETPFPAFNPATMATNARINDEITTRATETSGLAVRSLALEATATSGTSAAKNDNFAYWPDGQRNPIGWGDWLAEGAYTVERVGGVGSPYAVRTTNNANASSGFYQVVPVTAGKWVIEVTAKREAGSLNGSGVTLSGVGGWAIDFVGDPDVNGVVRDSNDGETRSWSKIVDLDGRATVNLHGMQGWFGFGRGVASHYIVWYKLSLRPAGPGDVAGVANAAEIVAAKSRISTVETAVTDGRFATAQRTSDIEVSLNNARGRLSTVETATTDGRFAATSRVTTLEAQGAGGLNVNANFNVAGYAGSIPYGWFDWTNGGALTTSAQPGRNGTLPVRMVRTGNIDIGIRAQIDNLAAGYYVLECEVQMFNGNWQGSAMHVNFGGVVSYNVSLGQTPDINEFAYGGNAYNRRTWSVLVNNPVQTTTQFYAMGGWSPYWDGSSNETHWHKCLIRPATDGEIKGQKALTGVNNVTARVTTNEGAVNDLKGRTAAYWQVTADAGNGRGQLTVRADNYGGGVDIVGDVRIRGANGNGSSYITSTSFQVIDNNGVERIYLGL